jgi:hypothetical protein
MLGLCLAGMLSFLPSRAEWLAELRADEPAHHDRMYKHARMLIALAKIRNEKDAVVLVASKTGKNPTVATEFAKMGGEVHYRADDVDYLRGRLPVDKIMALAASPLVQSLDLDIDIDHFDPTVDFPEPPEPPSATPLDPDTPLSHPYLPEKDMDISDLQAAHPTYDGRGVGMAILDATPDMLVPELQKATSIDGQPIRKISELLSVTDPRDDVDPMWVKMDRVVHVTEKQFTVDSVIYTAPADGEYRFGVFNERDLKNPSYLHKDVNFDGNPEGSSGLFSLLWDEKTNTVWVDTDQDHNFQNERALQDYVKRGDIGIFGKNQPAGARRHTVGFAVQTNAELHYIRLNLGVWQHVTEVSGATLGSGFYGGAYNGIAGQATFASYFSGDNSMYRRVEAVIDAGRDPKVDVICLEPAVIDDVTNPLHDGTLVAGVIFDRVTEKYKKPLLSPANNTFGMTTVLDEVSSHGILAVGGYQAGEAYRINNGAEVSEHDNLHLVSSFGPAGNGALKPDIISPSELISTDCGYKPPEKVKGVYELPPGYSMAGGTSTAGPSATAAMALLVSAAKQAKVKYDAERLRVAVISTARFIPRFQAYQEGNGLIQVNAAWEMLKALDKKWDPLTIESRGPVKTETAAFLDPPFQGPGIFEREGWAAGESGTRTVTFTRTSGGAAPIMYDVQWVGNRGAFEAAQSITLPLNKPVEFPIKIQTKEPGVYSAILNLKRPEFPGIAYQILNTVVAASAFTEANGFTVEEKFDAPRPGSESRFYYVPQGASALRVHLVIPNAKPTLRIYAFAPDRNTDLRWDYVGGTEKGTLDKVILNPVPGVWEIELWDNNFVFQPEQIDSKPLAPVPANLTVSLLGFTASPDVLKIPASGAGQAHTEHVRFSNAFSPIDAKSDSFPLGSEFETTRTIPAGEMQITDLEIPEGTARLEVSIGSASDPHADLDLYLYLATKGTMVLKGRSDSTSSNERVIIDHPDAGRWKFVVDAFRIPGGSVQYKYRDVYFHPAFGSVSVEDKDAVRNWKDSWDVSANVQVLATPVGERVLTGIAPVVAAAKAGDPLPSRPETPLAAVNGGSAPPTMVVIGESRVHVQ